MSGRKVVVTGGFGILGRAVAARFAAEGDEVIRVDYAPEAAGGEDSSKYRDIGGVDLTDLAAAQRTVETITQGGGNIDILVNIAGGFTWETLKDGSPESWNRMYAMNAQTCVNMTKAALESLLASPAGSVTNIGAYGALRVDAGMGSYGASKAAVHALTESLAAEMAGTSLRVNAVLPTIIDTPTNREAMPDANWDSWTTPEAAADVIFYLASPQAAAVNGVLLPLKLRG